MAKDIIQNITVVNVMINLVIRKLQHLSLPAVKWHFVPCGYLQLNLQCEMFYRMFS